MLNKTKVYHAVTAALVSPADLKEVKALIKLEEDCIKFWLVE